MMKKIFIVLFGFGVFIGICAFGEWIADNAPWIGYIGVATLIVYGMSRLYKQAYK